VTREGIALLLSAAALVGAIAGWVFNAGRQAQKFQELGDELRKDVNGLGRKYWRSIAFQLRSIAEEVTQPDVKAKLMNLAELIEPK
jgi:hypothetical protein